MATPDATAGPTPSPGRTGEGREEPEESPLRFSREEEEQEAEELHERRGSASSFQQDSMDSMSSQDQEQGSSNFSLLSDLTPDGDSSRPAKRIQAFVRVKPSADFAQEMIQFGPDNKSIHIHIPKDARAGAVNNSQAGWSFRLDGLLHSCSQDLLYRTVAKDVVAKALRGYNGTIMCYGQTGAGKTYTMTGATSEYKHRGIIPRAIQQVFKAAAESPNLSIHVGISYLEIYNEALFDLLSAVPGAGKRPLGVLDGPRGVRVRGLSVHPVSHEEQALSLLLEGETNRVVAEHALNRNSSRSHCIFTIYIECRSRDYTNLEHIKSKITLIDLAGSERLSQTRAEPQLQRETSYINRSLTFLEQILLALADPGRSHIPFRQSKLTHVLKDCLASIHGKHIYFNVLKSLCALQRDSHTLAVSPVLLEMELGGNCNTVLVTNICGEAAHVEETLSSLRFATRMKWIRTEPVPNVRFDREVSVKALEEEIYLLKKELALQDMLANRPVVPYSPLTASQRANIRSQVHKYLRGAIQEIDIVNVRQIQEVFKQFKVVVSQQEEAVEAKLRSRYTLRDKEGRGAEPEPGSAPEPDSAPESAGEQEEEGKQEEEKDEGSVVRVGGEDVDVEQEEDEDQEEALEPGIPSSTPGEKKEAKKSSEPLKKERPGTSPERDVDGSSPPKALEQSPSRAVGEEEEGAREQDTGGGEEGLSHPTSGEESQHTSSPPSRPEAFELFQEEAGSEISRIFRDNKGILCARKRRSNSVARRLNLIKREMEGIKEALEAKKQKRWQEGEYTDEKGQVIIDEEEFSLLLRLQELREGYRAGYAELQDLRAEIQYCQELVDKSRKRLMSEFEIWYNESFLIPEDVREALKPGGSIRPGMIPINRVLCLEEDEQDKFERMQETKLPECPASTPFYRARMKTEQQQTFNRTMASLRQMHRKPGIGTAAGKNKPLSFLHIV